MAVVALVTANRVSAVESIIQLTHPCGVDITAGQVIRLNTSGLWVLANSDTAGNARARAIALYTKKAGQALTGLQLGWLDGFNLDALAYDADVFLGGVANTAGVIDTVVSGTVAKTVGRVGAAHSQPFGTAPDKLLFVNLASL